MTDMNILYLFLLMLPFTVFLAGAFDLYTYQIPNELSITLVIGFYIFALINPNMTWSDIAAHSIVGTLAFITCFIMFCFGIFGGGDAKILAASSLWIGASDFIPYLYSITIFGGLLALSVSYLRGQACYPFILKTQWLSNLYFGNGNKRAIPYAIAIAAGMFVTLPSSHILQTSL